VRLTTGQNVIIPNVPDRKVGDLTEEPLLKELRYEPSEIMRGLVSCTGMDYCHFALIETKKRALETARCLEEKLGKTKPIRIHWSGCPAGCGNHAVADIGLLGKNIKVNEKVVEAVDIFVGGSAGPESNLPIKIMEDVPCDDLPRHLEGLIRHGAFKTMRQQLRTISQVSLHPEMTSPPKESGGKGPLIRLEDIPEGRGIMVRANGDEVAVFKSQSQLYAIQNLCPHEGGPLSGGSVEGEEVICPLHKYRFHLKTGACLTDRRLKARTFPLIAHGDGFKISEENLK
jgi:NAD(P)H-dependent nitrite reductase small subunit